MTELFTPADQAPAFDDLVGEGKKYSDPNAVAKAVFEKDQFIERLKQENAEARAELKARMNLEEAADRLLQNKPAAPQDPTPTTPRRDTLVKDETPAPDLAAEVQRLLKEEKARENRTLNLDKSIAGLKELYGADYQQALQKVSSDLGVTPDYLTDMASTTPNGFLNLVKSTVAPDVNKPGNPPQSTGGVQVDPKYTSKKNAEYYNELRKTDPKKYFSKQTQQEMYKSAKELGEAFFT